MRPLFRMRRVLCLAVVANLAATPASAALPETIAAVKPSVVGIGTMLRTRSPAIVFVATGFAVGDGLSIITNAHALPDLDVAGMEALGIVVGRGDRFDFRPAAVAAVDREHDIAHLRLSGTPLPPLRLDTDDSAAEGQALAFTGFPLGMALGLTPVTHRAMLSAVTPVVLPSLSARRLDARAIAQLQRRPFPIFQLDGTAYPGNSGSPVYDPDSGVVHGVLNMTLLKAQKENGLSTPSGISYAIPARYVRQLLLQSPITK
ncbi:S1 family peptidase [Pseudoduganella chitinolytica]|uniref:Serine protease n=1 Tax=Pseudoduganella chitinolytica TaxID=34070 RepID=A0ABY8B771_9BURK|nr:serine protease [Pseudoduganella chitinolytica]WEF31787.1 serine protease [Pseudoduganella chitinolytica]